MCFIPDLYLTVGKVNSCWEDFKIFDWNPFWVPPKSRRGCGDEECKYIGHSLTR